MRDHSPSARSHTFRTKFLIFPEFQLQLLGANLAVIVVIFGIIWFEMSRAFSDLSGAAGISGVEAEFYQNYLAFHAHELRVALLVSFVAATIISTFLTLFLSHRFSGPLVRMRGYFKMLSEQSPSPQPLPPLSFRRGDFLSDLPPLVNTALRRIQRPVPDEKAERESA